MGSALRLGPLFGLRRARLRVGLRGQVGGRLAPLEKPLEVLLARLALLLSAGADPLAQRLELLLLPVQQLALRAQRLLLPLLLGRRAGVRCGARG